MNKFIQQRHCEPAKQAKQSKRWIATPFTVDCLNGLPRLQKAQARNDSRLVNGYTLIEILIVMFIISIVTSVALLSVGRNENKRLESFANELVQTITLAEEQAMLQPVVLGILIDKHTVQFVSLVPSKNDGKNTWVALDDTLLGKQSIPSGIEVRVAAGNTHASAADEVTKNPQIIVSTNGDVTPFTIYIGKIGEKPRYAIIGDADGSITRKELS